MHLQLLRYLEQYYLTLDTTDIFDDNNPSASDTKILELINLNIVKTGEIGIPSLGDYVGIIGLLKDHSNNLLDNNEIMVTGAILTLINTCVDYAMMAPFFKELLGIEAKPSNTIYLLRQNQIKTLELCLEALTDANNYKKISPEIYNSYVELISEAKKVIVDSIIDAPTQNKINYLLKAILLGVFVAIRISGGYLIGKLLLTAVVTSAFVATPLGLAIIVTGILAFVYSGLKTRIQSIDHLLSPEIKQYKDVIRQKNNFRMQSLDHLYLIAKEKSAHLHTADIESPLRSLVTDEKVENDSFIPVSIQTFTSKVNQEKSLRNKNSLFVIFKDKEFSDSSHRHKFIDKLLGIQHTRTWKKNVKDMRLEAWTHLKEKVSATDDIAAKTAMLSEAKKLELFNIHRGNSIFARGRTLTIKEIDKHIQLINRMSKAS